MPIQSQTKRRSTAQTPEKPVKRTRVSRACDQCRTAREKCDGSQPTCSTCSTQNRQCSYTTNPKRRGIQPGYIRSLELALAWLFQLNPENESLLNEQLSEGGNTSIFLTRDSKESNKLHKRWRKARFYSDVDKFLSGGEPARHGHAESRSLQSDSEDESDEEPAPVVRSAKLSETIGIGTTRVPVAELPFELQPAASKSAKLVLPLDSWTLLEGYFTYIQSWLPICEKYDILKLSYVYPTDGLDLSAARRDSGSHAELWSILAVASLQEKSRVDTLHEPYDLYNVARSLIPDELGKYDLGHVKTMLNLAVFNMARDRGDAARILVGLASRVLDALSESDLISTSRLKHVLSGCYLLDSYLSVQFDRRTYFLRAEVAELGAIDEDGLEEWQAWNGPTSSLEGTRMPMLALSLFNSLLGLIDILATATSSSSRLLMQQHLDRLTSWEFSLPSKLAYVRSTARHSQMNPPATLHQLTYHCTCFIVKHSRSNLTQFFEILKTTQRQIGHRGIPPVAQALLSQIWKQQSLLTEDDRVILREFMNQSEKELGVKSRSEESSQSALQRIVPIAAAHIPTPDSIQASLPVMQAPTVQPLIFPSMDPGPGTIEDLGSGTPDLAGLSLPPTMRLDPRYPAVENDLDTFFDELAALDSGTRLDNQPQFMQNLGFAPGANMADLFSEYIPLQSSSFLPLDDTAPVTFDYGFYDA